LPHLLMGPVQNELTAAHGRRRQFSIGTGFKCDSLSVREIDQDLKALSRARKCRGRCLRLHRIERRQPNYIALDYCSCRQAEFFLKTSGDKLHTNWHAVG